jgi:hypothetical protein
MTHQWHIAWVVSVILTQSPECLLAFKRGNPFDKLLRSFDEFTTNGVRLYKQDVGARHYKMSEAAFHAGLPASGLYGEHKIPIKIVIGMLLASDRTYESVLEILKMNEVILITENEHQRLDGAKRRDGQGRGQPGPPHDCRPAASRPSFAFLRRFHSVEHQAR